MNIAIIPARGGSQRIPRKNIRPFCGRPMIAHTINAALKSGAVDAVVVSTDDQEIADIAMREGALVPFIRPSSLADENTGTAPVIRHAITTLQEQGWALEHCACIYATAPLLSPLLVREGLMKLKSRADTTFTFTAARFSFPIQRALLTTPQGGVVPFDPQSIKKRSQDLAPAYHDAGQLYWAHHSVWMDPDIPIFSPESQMLVLPDYLVCDIDTVEDWERAEVLLEVLQRQGKL